MQSVVTKQEVILIVDDDSNNLRLLAKIMTNKGYKVLIAQNGINGIETATKAIPDMILLDIQMPNLDGIEVCQRLKSQVLTQNIPIIFITGMSATQSKVEGLTIGAVDYITKPIEEEEVLARINTHLTIRNLQKALAKQNQRLEKQVKEEQLFTKIAERIRSSLELNEILSQVAQGVQQLLHCDRVLITSVTNNHASLEVQVIERGISELVAQTSTWQILYSDREQYPQYQEGYYHSFNDVNIWDDPELKELYQQWDIKAEIVMPIWLDTNQAVRTIKQEGYELPAESWLTYAEPENTQNNSNNLSFFSFWGYLIIHQCNAPRQWLESEIHLLQRLSTQLSIAIKQALLYQEIKTANTELQKLAVRDPLTGVFNRRYFEQQLSLEWRRLTRNPSPLSLIMCDVDHFKIYNDTYGHQQGDECLCQVARAIASCTRRATDVVCRYGGEEFVVILPHTHLEGAVKVAEYINVQVKELNLEHANSPTNSMVTISLGVACTTTSRNSNAQCLIKNADRALYTAKSKGRNRLAVYQPDFNS
ncbi:MAG: diguanylate cyclase [Xenococcaceae cyanobacterium MO_188.B32]|nr:diguanylate cyclase [Xenococcaceae cyanobacterium MO_188.B32]